MKKTLVLALSALLSLALASTAAAHCGSCGVGGPTDHDQECKDKCATSQESDCVAKCMEEHEEGGDTAAE